MYISRTRILSLHKGYKCLAANGKIYNLHLQNVIFSEVRFPYSSMFTTEKSTFIPTVPVISPTVIQGVTLVSPVHNTQVPSPALAQSSSTTSFSPPKPPKNQLDCPPNIYPMQIRSKSGIRKPRIHPTLLTQAEPTTTKQALAILEWIASMTAEYEASMKNGTQTLFPIPTNKEAIGCKLGNHLE